MDIFRLNPVGIVLLERSRQALTDQLIFLPRQEHFIEEKEGSTLIGDQWIKDLFTLTRRKDPSPLPVFKADPNGGLAHWKAGEVELEVQRNSFKVELHLGEAVPFRAGSASGVKIDWSGMQNFVSRLYHENKPTYQAYRAWAFILREALPAADIVCLFVETEKQAYEQVRAR